MQKETYKNYIITIQQDEYTESPRDWDNLGLMVCFHGRYNLGDKHNFNDVEALQSHLKNEAAIYLPLYLYDHGGITMNTSGFNCAWDSGQVGYIYIDPEKVIKEFAGIGKYLEPCLVGKKPSQVKEYLKNPPNKIWKKLQERIIKALENEVKTYDQYLTGDIYHYNIETKSGEDVDGCSGFYGYEDTLKEAKSVCDWHEKQSLPLLNHANLIA